MMESKKMDICHERKKKAQIKAVYTDYGLPGCDQRVAEMNQQPAFEVGEL